MPGARIAQADRLHRPEAQRVAAAARDLFDRQAALEVVQVLPIFGVDRLRFQQRVEKAVVLFLRHRAVDVVGGAFVVARGHVHARHVDGVGFDDGTDGVVEVKLLAAAQAQDLARQRVGRERSGGDDRDRIVFVDARDFLAHDFDQRLALRSPSSPPRQIFRDRQPARVRRERRSGARSPSAANRRGASLLSAATARCFRCRTSASWSRPARRSSPV